MSLPRGRHVRALREPGIVSAWKNPSQHGYAIALAWAVGGIAVLLVVQNSARRLVSQSAFAGAPAPLAGVTPFIDLRSVEVRARQSGRPILRLRADHLVLYRDLRTASIDGISDGAAYRAGPSLPGLSFSAGHARIQAGYGNTVSGALRLDHGVTAQTTTADFPVRATTDSLEWRWPAGRIAATSPVQVTIGSLGQVQAAGLDVSPSQRWASFGSVRAALSAPMIGAPSSPAPAKSSSENVTVFAPQGGRWDEQARTLTLRGPVTFRQGEASMQTVGAVYDRGANTARAMSPVTVRDKQNILTGSQGVVDFGTHVATLTGDVRLSAVPDQEPPPAKAGATLDTEARQPTRMACDHMAYNYRKKLADASGHLIITQTSRTVTADAGHYDANTQIISLQGHVDGRSTDGKHLKAPTATVSVKRGDEWIEVSGPIQYEFPVGDEDNPVPKPLAPAAARPSNSPAR